MKEAIQASNLRQLSVVTHNHCHVVSLPIYSTHQNRSSSQFRKPVCLEWITLCLFISGTVFRTKWLPIDRLRGMLTHGCISRGMESQNKCLLSYCCCYCFYTILLLLLACCVYYFYCGVDIRELVTPDRLDNSSMPKNLHYHHCFIHQCQWLHAVCSQFIDDIEVRQEVTCMICMPSISSAQQNKFIYSIQAFSLHTGTLCVNCI